MAHGIKRFWLLLAMLLSISAHAKNTSPQPKTYGPTQASDTLWNIAVANKTKEVSVYQMMTAIYNTNPDAFINGNIHVLKPKQKLRIPTASDAGKINRKQAFAAIEKLNGKKNDETKKAELPSPVVIAEQNQRAKELNALAEESDQIEPKIQDLDSLLEKTIQIGRKHHEIQQKKPGAISNTPEAEALQQNLMKSQQALISLEKEDAGLAKQLGDLNGEMSTLLATLQQTETGATFQ